MEEDLSRFNKRLEKGRAQRGGGESWYPRFGEVLEGPLNRVKAIRMLGGIGGLMTVMGTVLLIFRPGTSPGRIGLPIPAAFMVVQIVVGIALAIPALMAWRDKSRMRAAARLHGTVAVLIVPAYTLMMVLVASGLLTHGPVAMGHAPGILAYLAALGTRMRLESQDGPVPPDPAATKRSVRVAMVLGGVCDAVVLGAMFWCFSRLMEHPNF